MRILVTGASGYVGSYLIRWLAAGSIDLGAVSRRKPDYLQPILGANPFYLADLESLPTLKVNESYDIVIHLASANDIDSADPYTALLSTGYGARKAVEFCKFNNIPRLIYFSTFQVYGTSEGSVSATTPIHCRNDYALTHLVGEEYIRLAQTRQEIEGIIFRPTNIYGAPLTADIDRWSLVPGCFCKEAVNSGTITLQSSGKQVRDFISLEDISHLTYLFCEQFDTWKNQTINLASGQVQSIRETADLTAKVYNELTGKLCSVKTLSEQPAMVNTLLVDTKIMDSLPYFCKNTMKTEIRKTLELLGLKNGPN
jgi:UDP-glucose 4-epimerase